MPVSALKPYGNNAKKHTREQIDAVANSIREFGFRNPVIAWTNEDGQAEIVAGHGRVAAARKLGMEEVPVILCDDLTDAQRRALTLADNQTTMMTGWDADALAYELDVLAGEFDMADFGFDMKEDEDETYTRKVEGLYYEPSGIRPTVGELVDTAEYDEKMGIVAAAEVTEEVRGFLAMAAARFLRFDYEAIAEYYCNAPESEREAMRELWLVIVDEGGVIGEAAREFQLATEGL